MRIFFIFFFIINNFHLFAQIDTTKKALPDVVVFANKFPTLSKNIVQKVDFISDKNAINQQSNTGDILSQSGQVFVQKSQSGGGSPVIRGFEASRVLLMVDGVRLNNAIFRGGHLQNIITIDNMILDRVEVIYGPSSTLYGSDALGGVVNMFTKKPILTTTTNWKKNANLIQRYASGQNENRTHLDINIANNKWAYLTSFTYGRFGDMRQGANRSSAYPEFGKRSFYVVREAGVDVVKVNEDVNVQKLSGYQQTDLLQKVLYKPNENAEHLLNIQISNSSNINRYDRLTETSKGLPVYSEWYYGPQIRNLFSYKYTAIKLPGYFSDLMVTSSFQDIEESRISRKYNTTSKDFRFERVNVLGVNADLLHKQSNGEIHLGAESYTNFVRSTAERLNITTSALSRITTRYSDGPTKMSYNALYLQQTKQLDAHWVINDGIRFNLVQLDASFVDTSLMHFPFTKAIQNNIAVTGNLGIAYNGENGYRATAGLSSGFRAPNIDDLTKVFDTRTGYVVVPNKDLKPEYTYNAEINISHTGNSASWGASIFYTWFNNAIVVSKYNWNGQDNIMYQNVLSAVYAPQNQASAKLYGFNLNGKLKLFYNTLLQGTYTYTKGTYNNGTSSMPLDHIPPAYGRVGLKKGDDKFNVEGFVLFNGWKRIRDYNLNGEDNEIYATQEGMPSWMTVNFSSYYTPNKKLSLGVQIENIADKNYRYFASGISAMGRNFIVSCRLSF
ncbi:MAG TPA: TonB-dependent receptor [Chitinophagaceae bacterium]|nr:TonB-dependent receptor [Chitinophagaceae bacterium]